MRWRTEGVTMVALFLDLGGFGMLVADIQLRAAGMVPSGWPIGAIVGGLLASTFITQILVSPRWGVLSDSIGRKPVLIACSLFSAVAMLVYGIAGEIWLLLASRILSGLGAANVAVAQAYISDLYEGPSRTAAMGRITAAISAGLVIGPPIGGFISAFGSHAAVGFVAGGASLVGAIALAVVLPNVKPTAVRRPGKAPVFDVRILGEYPELRRFVVIAAVAWFSLATLEGTFARLIKSLFGYNQFHFGIIFGYESLLGVLVSGAALAWLVSRIHEQPLLRAGFLFQGVGLAMNPLAAFVPIYPMVSLMVASTLYALGVGVANPTINAICSRLVPEDRQGELFGILQSARSLGFVLGPVLGGILFDWQHSAPYYVAGAVCVLAAFLASPAKAASQPEPVSS